MALDLDGVHLKLARAREHFKLVEAKVAGYIYDRPYSIVMKDDPSGDKIPVVDITQEPPAEIVAIFGDGLQNLRSALDHLAWQIVQLLGGTPIEGETRFPIFKRQVGGRKPYEGIKGAPTKGPLAEIVRARVDWHQPFNWDQPETHPLAILNDLANIDRHRYLHLIAVAWDIESLRNIVYAEIAKDLADGESRPIRIASYRFMGVNAHRVLKVTLDEYPHLVGFPITDLANHLMRGVELIIGEFEYFWPEHLVPDLLADPPVIGELDST